MDMTFEESGGGAMGDGRLGPAMTRKISEVLTALRERGGSAAFPQLRGCSRRALGHALRLRLVRRIGRGYYRLADAAPDADRARALKGARSHLTAALAYDWPIAVRPRSVHVSVPRGRNISRRRRGSGVVLHRRNLSQGELANALTTPLNTVIDCCSVLPFPEALAVADSALRSGLVQELELRTALAKVVGRGSGVARRVARTVDARAANPMESVLRGIALDVPGLAPVPQFRVADEEFTAYADLADETLRIIAEAEGLEFHGGQSAFERDITRYRNLAIRGWMILRFSWWDIFHRPKLVARHLRAAVLQRRHELGLATP